MRDGNRKRHGALRSLVLVVALLMLAQMLSVPLTHTRGVVKVLAREGNPAPPAPQDAVADGPASQLAPNMIKNGSFEQDNDGNGKPDMWIGNGPVAANAFSRSSVMKYGTNGTFSIRHFSTGNVSYLVSQVVTGVQAGQAYRVGLWTNIPATADSFSYSVELLWRTSANARISTHLIRRYTGATTGWTFGGNTYIAPAGATNAVVRMNVFDLNATIYSDVFNFRLESSATPTATANPTATDSPTATVPPTATRTATAPATSTATTSPSRTPTQRIVIPGEQVGYSTQNGGTTGGAGGPVVNASTGTQIHQALCSRASNSSPIIIRVSGIINHGNTTQVSGSCSTAAGVIELKDISNVTIVGVGSTAIFDQIGIHIRNSRNIIIQNVHIRNVKKSGSPTSNGGDAIGMESNVSNVWVDHCTLEASGGEAEGYDGLFDLKNNTRYVTLSYSHLLNSERGGLVGSGDTDSQNNFITYHHNHYQNLNSRVPLLRFATAHAFNNYYNGIVESGMNPRIGGRIKAENNYFENAKDPLGTFYTNDMGYWEVSGNIWGPGVTWSAPGDNNHPAGPNVVSTTSISIPYAYSLDPASNVKSIVLNNAGVGKIGG